MCDKAVSECSEWGASQAPHCNAWKSGDWNFKKSLVKMLNTEEAAPVGQTPTQSSNVSTRPAVSTSGWGFADYAWHNRNREWRARPQKSPPRWGESTLTGGGCQSWGWEQELQKRNRQQQQNDEATATPAVDLTNVPGPSTAIPAATAWGAQKSSSLKREHESKGSSSNGNSPNRSSDDSDVEFVVDRTNEREEFGDDGPILNFTNISRFEWRAFFQVTVSQLRGKVKASSILFQGKRRSFHTLTESLRSHQDLLQVDQAAETPTPSTARP